MAALARALHTFGFPITENIEVLRTFVVLYGRTFRRLFDFPWRGTEIYQAISQIGVGSLPIIAVSTAFAGLVITNEIAWHMNEALHTVAMIPGFTGQFILREVGIAMPALLIVAKVGASMTAEVATMKVTEQIDALKLLKIDPISYLVFPRWVACIISLVCLTLISIAITLGCAIAVAVVKYNFTVLEYITALRHFIEMNDLLCAVVKSSIFGSMIPIFACSYGFRCTGGAQGVGTATTNAVVATTISIIIVDFILTYFFTSIMS
jgi:phospholipid/cholesterol/gamma-HCH transport system permease protein